ncbi:MAG: hypothetical protein AB7F22_18260 [Reyranella sp.]|uniref:hypothetical protein n=1 Tax=Reyranella sp. TaxID=1929291 RepID=UPI003D0A0F06
MIQLDPAHIRSAACLPSLDSGSNEPSMFPKPDTGSALDGWATGSDAVEFVPYVSPPPMPWPRVFPSL